MRANLWIGIILSTHFIHFLSDVHVVNGEDGLHFLLTEFGQRNGELIFAVPDKEDQQKMGFPMGNSLPNYLWFSQEAAIFI